MFWILPVSYLHCIHITVNCSFETVISLAQKSDVIVKFYPFISAIPRSSIIGVELKLRTFLTHALNWSRHIHASPIFPPEVKNTRSTRRPQRWFGYSGREKRFALLPGTEPWSFSFVANCFPDSAVRLSVCLTMQ
jgi:hypothetical protein